MQEILLGDPEAPGDGGGLIISAQGDHGHHIAARLGGRCGGAGIKPPAAGQTGVQVVDALLGDADLESGAELHQRRRGRGV